MAVPFSYSFRNLLRRRTTTILTAAGMALVVFVFASVLMLAEGLQQTLVETGSRENVIVVRKGSTSEVVSGVEREKAAVVETQPEIAGGPRGQKFAARELVVLIALPKRGTGQPSNVTIRGIGENSLALRPQVRIVEGRAPRLGSREVMVGMSIAKRFKGTGINEKLCCGMQEWTIVGIFDAGNTGFNSEIWGDADQLMQAFRRPAYSLVIFKLRDSSGFEAVRARIDGDPRLSLEAKRESLYYAEQSRAMAKFLRILGLSLTSIFSIGAIVGAMITMYSAVASRTNEIGTLRALGYRRSNILAAFLAEALLLGFFGGVAGIFFASFMQLITVSTMNFQTFAELAFGFTLSPAIAAESMAFAFIMGFVGGVLPALRAAKMNIVESLRAD
ncbi:MAG TPA: ABC transporter permease [Syntrophales bacterium]|nr:ABC transporter permease [Syntrophales bacterium]HOX93256.1 ABC transporter permease [Syntrophales bacterium]HPI56270.1 ABC transporter permease [Syntrophales bacterium]HPN24457.1 ABC transporter permease [Syntrophales bacterium]HQM29087.1 ABC transporter permease [Syntrophales bacterium]